MININLQELLEQNNDSKSTKVANTFFNDEHPEGYTSKEEFKKYLLEQKPKGGTRNWRITHINNFFLHAKQGRRLVRVPEETWEDGEKWMWCNFNLGKVTQSLKIPDGGGMHELIRDYANGQTNVTYTLEDLLNQATEAS